MLEPNQPLPQTARHLVSRLLLLMSLSLTTGCAPNTNTRVDADPAEQQASQDDPRRDGLTRIAIGSCADQRKPQPIWSAILEARPQLFLFIGDNVYGDVAGDDPAMPELAEAYAQMGQVEGFNALREAVPVMPIWDDHDYGANDAGNDFALRVQAEELFQQFWGIADPDPRARRAGLYHSEVFGPPGRRVQVILLDTRSFRSALTPSDAPDTPGKQRYIPEEDPTRTMLGDAQWRWLEDTLRDPAELRVVVSSIQVIAEGHGWERWGLLPVERRRLMTLLGQHPGTVLISGDRHLGALYKDARGPYPIYELTTSSLNRPLNRDIDEPGPRRISDVYTSENFGMIEIDWQRAALTLSLRNLQGDPVRAHTIALEELQ